MNRRLSRSLLRSLWVSGVALGMVGGSRTAFAVGKDATALKMEKDAIYNDYLATKFEVAEKKIKAALGMCRASSCSASVLARLHRDLATIYIMGIKRPDEAKKEFIAALRADPDVSLIKDLTTPELEAAFNEAKGGPPAGAESSGELAEEAKSAKPSRAAPVAAKGDIDHSPPPEQAVSTPLPLFAIMPDGVKVTKATVKFKPFGGEWKTVDMKKYKDGWAVEVSCQDVGGAVGDFKYYIQGFEASGDVVANSGTKGAPNTVPIRSQLSGDAPHLPGKAAPVSCAENIDCPPDMPGCSSKKKKKQGKPAGEPCDEASECQEGASCTKGLCSGGGDAEPAKCISSEDCDGVPCVEGVCGASHGAAKNNWFGLYLQQEMLLVPSSGSACTGTDAAYSCFYGDGSYVYPILPADQDQGRTLVPSKGGNKVNSGIARATARILIGYDRVFAKNIQVGARAGFAIFGEPSGPETKSFMPFHLEVRGSYFFGAHPFQNKGFRPFLGVSGGVAEVDAAVPIQIFQQEWEEPTTVNAWHKTGTGFVGLGGGTQYALGLANAIVAELRVMQMLGTSGTALGLNIGFAHGL